MHVGGESLASEAEVWQPRDGGGISTDTHEEQAGISGSPRKKVTVATAQLRCDSLLAAVRAASAARSPPPAARARARARAPHCDGDNARVHGIYS